MPRTVFITGGAGGIGHALAEAFLAEGDKVILSDRPGPALEAAAAGLGVPAIAADLTDPAAVTAAFARLEADHGPVEVLVNNAGILDRHGRLVDLDVADYAATLDVNVLGTFLATQAAARQMIAHAVEGAIVMISSVGGRQPTPGMGAYESSKAAVDALVRWAAIELADQRIRVNAVAPGPVLTPAMAADWPAGSPGRVAWEQRVPLRQLAEPAQVAAAAVFLASAGAGHITGVSLAVDGGQWLA